MNDHFFTLARKLNLPTFFPKFKRIPTVCNTSSHDIMHDGLSYIYVAGEHHNPNKLIYHIRGIQFKNYFGKARAITFSNYFDDEDSFFSRREMQVKTWNELLAALPNMRVDEVDNIVEYIVEAVMVFSKIPENEAKELVDILDVLLSFYKIELSDVSLIKSLTSNFELLKRRLA